MTEREAFIEAIAADPNDDTVRLAFADWLQEHGEEDRAEFVRLSYALAAGSQQVEDLNQIPAELQRIRKRILDLLRTRGPAWFDPFCRALGKESIFAPHGRLATRLWQRVTGRAHRMDHLQLHKPFWQQQFDRGQIHLHEPANGVMSIVELRHGFVERTSILLAPGPPIGGVAAAFRSEPVNSLMVRTTNCFDRWHCLNVPALILLR